MAPRSTCNSSTRPAKSRLQRRFPARAASMAARRTTGAGISGVSIFPSCNQPGTYRVAADYGDARGESFPFVVDRGAVLNQTATDAVDFFFIQRCGFDVPGWHKALPSRRCQAARRHAPGCDRRLAQRGRLQQADVAVRRQRSQAYALAMASAAQPELFGTLRSRRRRGLADALDEAWWGAKFLAKMQNPADGSMRGDVLQGPGRTWMRWKAPDVHTDNKIGTEDDPVIAPGTSNVPLTIAAWASLARELDARGAAERLSRAGRAAVAFLDELRVGRRQSAVAHRGPGAAPHDQGRQVSAIRPTQRRSAFSNSRSRTARCPAIRAIMATWRPRPWRCSPCNTPMIRWRLAIVRALGRYLDFCIARTDNPFGLDAPGHGRARGDVFSSDGRDGSQFLDSVAGLGRPADPPIDARSTGAGLCHRSDRLGAGQEPVESVHVRRPRRAESARATTIATT